MTKDHIYHDRRSHDSRPILPIQTCCHSNSPSAFPSASLPPASAYPRKQRKSDSSCFLPPIYWQSAGRTDGQKHRRTHTHTLTQTETRNLTNGQTARHETDRQKDRMTERQKDRKTERQNNRKTGRQDRPWQERKGQGRKGQDRAWQDRSGQAKA